MSFAKRVIKQRQDAGLADVTKLPKDMHALAAEHVELSFNSEEKEIAWPRASSIYKACIRQHVIGDVLGRSMKEFLSIKDKLLYGIGNAIHYWLQNEPTIFGDRRYGWWKCSACRSLLYFGKPPSGKCPKCGAYPEAIRYFEHSLRGVGEDEDRFLVTGHPDLFLPRKTKRVILRVTEIKSIGGEDFDKLQAPLIEHEWQLQTYMWACSLDDRIPAKIDSNAGYIFYVCKRHKVKELPMKMFKVHRSEPILLRIKEKLNQFRIGRENYPEKLPPPDERCLRGGMSSYMTKSCVVKEECLKFYGEE